jgi:hypothetical protein
MRILKIARLRFVVILKPETDMDTVKTEIDAVYPSIQI